MTQLHPASVMVALAALSFGPSCSSTAAGVAEALEPASNLATPLLFANEFAESVRWLAGSLQEIRFENPIARGQLEALRGALGDPEGRAWQSLAENGAHSFVVRPLSAEALKNWADGYPQAFFGAVRLAVLPGDTAFRFTEESGRFPFLVCVQSGVCFYQLPMVSVGRIDPAPTPSSFGDALRLQCYGTAGVGGGIFLARDEFFGGRTILSKSPILSDLLRTLENGTGRLVATRSHTGGH